MMEENSIEILKEILKMYEENKKLKNDLQKTKEACQEWYELYEKLLHKYKEATNGL